jgi:hypothetical protein
MIKLMKSCTRLRYLTIALFAAVMLVGHGTASAGASLPDFNARYTLYKGSFSIGKARVRLQSDDGRRVYSSHTEPAGLLALFRDDIITERSVWQFHDGNIQPLEYQYSHENGKKSRHVELMFHWNENRVDNTAEGHTWSMDIPDGTLDKFSVQLAVMLDLQRHERGDDLRYDIADGGKLKNWSFQVLGHERIETDAGEFETIKLKRLRHSYDRQTIMWCAPALNYLLVKIEHTEEDDGTFTMELDKVDGLPVTRTTSAGQAR